MKVKFMFIAATVALITLASCKKEYECTCVTGFNDPVDEKHKGKNANDACSKGTKILQLKTCVPK